MQWIGQRQLQDETRNIEVLGFDATYITGFTLVKLPQDTYNWHPVPWVAGQRYGVSFVSSKYDLYSESLHCYIQYCVWTGPCYNGIQQFMAPVLLITMPVDGPGLVWVDPMKTIKLDILSLNFLWLLKILNIYLRPWNFFQEWWSGCMKAHRTLLSVNSFGHHSNHFIDMGHHRFI